MYCIVIWLSESAWAGSGQQCPCCHVRRVQGALHEDSRRRICFRSRSSSSRRRRRRSHINLGKQHVTAAPRNQTNKSTTQAGPANEIRLHGIQLTSEIFLLPSPPQKFFQHVSCLLYTSPSPRDRQKSRMPSSA